VVEVFVDVEQDHAEEAMKNGFLHVDAPAAIASSSSFFLSMTRESRSPKTIIHSFSTCNTHEP
jgi:hypothetical protein